MIKILFVCLGNICRSPMAEGIFKQMLESQGLDHDFYVESRATSNYEIGNPPHPETRKILDKMNIDHKYMRAKQIVDSDFFEYDYIIGMDSANVYHLNKEKPVHAKSRIFRLLDFVASSKKDIADPWYTHDFELTKRDIERGLHHFLEYLLHK